MSSVWLCIFSIKMMIGPTASRNIGFKVLIPITMYVDSTQIEHFQWFTTAQHYVPPDKDSFTTKFVELFYVGRMLL